MAITKCINLLNCQPHLNKVWSILEQLRKMRAMWCTEKACERAGLPLLARASHSERKAAALGQVVRSLKFHGKHSSRVRFVRIRARTTRSRFRSEKRTRPHRSVITHSQQNTASPTIFFQSKKTWRFSLQEREKKRCNLFSFYNWMIMILKLHATTQRSKNIVNIS